MTQRLAEATRQEEIMPTDRVAQRGRTWTLGAAVVGGMSSAIASGWLELSREWFVLVHLVVVAAFTWVFVSYHGLTIRTQLGRRWLPGLVVGLFVGAVLARQVIGQPGSPRSSGFALTGDLAWFGVVYGTVDALLLTVLPVIALYGLRPPAELAQSNLRLRWALVALAGSALVTAAYHAGFTEFRGPQLIQPVIGNLLITLAYLLTGSPVAAIVSHVAMHVAAVLHGMATTIQLPPHY
jgi:hypothetical protein